MSQKSEEEIDGESPYRIVSPFVTSVIAAVAGGLFVIAAIVFSRAVVSSQDVDLVNTWTVNVLDDALDLNEEHPTLRLVGRFDCTDQARREDPNVRYHTSFHSVAGADEVWEVRRLTPPARDASTVCASHGEAVEFTWLIGDDVIDNLTEVIDGPTSAVALLSAEAGGGWKVATAQTQPFTIIPPDPED